VNNELERLLEEVALVYLRFCSGIRLEGLSKITKKAY